MYSFNFLIFQIILVLAFVTWTKCSETTDYFMFGKSVPTDDKIFDHDFRTNYVHDGNVYSEHEKGKSSSNATHFTFDFSKPGICITGIHVESERADGSKGFSTGKIYCKEGGIGSNRCLLVFVKVEKRRNAKVMIYAMNEPCSFKSRFLISAETKDGYDLPYSFNPSTRCSTLQPNLQHFTFGAKKGAFQQNYFGLINKPMNCLHETDDLTASLEMFPKNQKISYMYIVNTGKRRISFLDVYFYQEEESGQYNMPNIYFDGGCGPSTNPCALVFDGYERITYILVKVYKNKGGKGIN
uniref:Lufaxin n=1 Tax=Sergentomyia schwetzi TaxID=114605 RepID=A0A6B9VM74_9DIPT|nr:lufaxin [Sergentomyia schwetzi]